MMFKPASHGGEDGAAIRQGDKANGQKRGQEPVSPDHADIKTV